MASYRDLRVADRALISIQCDVNNPLARLPYDGVAKYVCACEVNDDGEDYWN